MTLQPQTASLLGLQIEFIPDTSDTADIIRFIGSNFEFLFQPAHNVMNRSEHVFNRVIVISPYMVGAHFKCHNLPAVGNEKLKCVELP